jgi:hypothetical protein
MAGTHCTFATSQIIIYFLLVSVTFEKLAGKLHRDEVLCPVVSSCCWVEQDRKGESATYEVQPFFWFDDNRPLGHGNLHRSARS